MSDDIQEDLDSAAYYYQQQLETERWAKAMRHLGAQSVRSWQDYCRYADETVHARTQPTRLPPVLEPGQPPF